MVSGSRMRSGGRPVISAPIRAVILRMPSFALTWVVVMTDPSLLGTIGSEGECSGSGTGCAAHPLEVDVTAGLEELREPHGSKDTKSVVFIKYELGNMQGRWGQRAGAPGGLPDVE